MINENEILIKNDPKTPYMKNCLSWKSILAGSIVMVGLSFLMNLFCTAIGLTAFHNSPEGIKTLAIGGFIGLLIGTIAVTYFSGWVAGFLGRCHCHNRHYGTFYGLLTWCLGLILIVILASSISSFMLKQNQDLSNSNPVPRMIAGTSSTFSSNTVAQNTQTATNQLVNAPNTAEGTATKLGISLFALFILFFVGAVASCFGGYHGMKPKVIREKL